MHQEIKRDSKDNPNYLYLYYEDLNICKTIDCIFLENDNKKIHRELLELKLVRKLNTNTPPEPFISQLPITSRVKAPYIEDKRGFVYPRDSPPPEHTEQLPMPYS